MQPALYEASVPVFLHYLARVEGLFSAALRGNGWMRWNRRRSTAPGPARFPIAPVSRI